MSPPVIPPEARPLEGLSPAERIKAESRGLRGTLAEGLAEGLGVWRVE